MKQLFLRLIHFYQKTAWFHKQIFRALYLSDRVCRFTPTCSEYCCQAIEQYGIIKGCWWCFRRVIRCHPWQKGGLDPLK